MRDVKEVVQAAGPSIRRRGIMAGIAALVVGGLSKASERVTHAVNGDPINVGGNVTGTSTTTLTNSQPTVVFDAISGIGGQGAGNGVRGLTQTGTGLNGESNSGVGVFGVSNTFLGVYGYSYGTGGNAVGVYGVANSGEGVAAISQTGIALHANSPSGVAGRFDGPVVVNGDFSATGMKSALVPLAGGDLGRLYCMESPESLFEDFGRTTVSGGQASVQLAADFAAVVRTDDYDVFLTPYGDCAGLGVASRTSTGFEIRELQGGTHTLEVAYRVVAKRKDIEAPRLQRVAPQRVPNRNGVPRAPGVNNIPGMGTGPAPSAPSNSGGGSLRPDNR